MTQYLKHRSNRPLAFALTVIMALILLTGPLANTAHAATTHYASSEATLEAALSSAITGDEIQITADFALSKVITIPTGKDLTITSDISLPGSPFTITQSTLNTYHFFISRCHATFQDIILDGGTVRDTDGSVLTQGGGGINTTTATAPAPVVLELGSGAVLQNCYMDSCIINLNNLAHLIMRSGSAISDNYDKFAAVRMNRLSVFDMHGGKITGNRSSTGDSTTAIDVSGGGVFNMYGGELSDNKGANGCAIKSMPGRATGNVYYLGEVNIYDGLITNNEGDSHGPIYLTGYSTFLMEDGEISHNKVKAGGGIISARLSDMYTQQPMGTYHSIRGTSTTPEDTNITFGSASDPTKQPRIHHNEIGSAPVNLICPMSTLKIYNISITDHISTNKVNPQYGTTTGGLYIENSDVDFFNGEIKLNEVVRTDDSFIPGGNVGGLFYSAKGKTFTMYDGEISDNIAGGAYGGFYVQNGTFIMGDPTGAIAGNPTIAGNKAMGGAGGGGMVIYSHDTKQPAVLNSSFQMYAGEIRDNEAFASIGGIALWDTATSVNGHPHAGSTFELAGGAIKNNKSLNGHAGGIYIDGQFASFTQTDGEISGNSAAASGGGIYFTKGAVGEMKDGVIKDNQAGRYGGGVSLDAGYFYEDSAKPAYPSRVRIGEFRIDAAPGASPTIENNTAVHGGGISIARAVHISQTEVLGILEIASTGVTIKDNTALGSGGGIYTMAKDYSNLDIHADTIFDGNQARTTEAPPANADATYPDIGYAATSVSAHPLDNNDINNIEPFDLDIKPSNTAGKINTPIAGTYLPGTYIFIETELIDQNEDFLDWMTQYGSFFNYLSESTVFIMPTSDDEIVARYTGAPLVPAVLSVTPSGTDTDVSGDIKIIFNSSMDTTAGIGKVSLDNGVGQLTGGNWSKTNVANDTYTIAYNGLVNSTTYTVTIESFRESTGVLWMMRDDNYDFTTAATSTTPPGPGITTYIVTYNANGGVGSDHQVSEILANSKHTMLTASVAGISREGYDFMGWNTKADGIGTAYAAGSSLTVTQSLTLYAQWKKTADKDGLFESTLHPVYLNGYPDGSIRPDNPMTRAEVASIFYRLLKTSGTAQGGSFPDVVDSAWYAQAINYLTSIGVLNGYPDGSFKPNAFITRAEFTAIVSRVSVLDGATVNVFPDVRSDSWAANYINSVYAKGWIKGYPDGTFKPDNDIARAEVVKIVNTMLNRKIDKETLAQVKNPYQDLSKDHWAYADIIEASVVHEYTRDNTGGEIWKTW
ncbi:MAG TPA: S-layer homology domain-containing protein [Clostridiales bacterium]|nr:S-layer homology domain-containing protein [Clostridiales bacterium]